MAESSPPPRRPAPPPNDGGAEEVCATPRPAPKGEKDPAREGSGPPGVRPTPPPSQPPSTRAAPASSRRDAAPPSPRTPAQSGRELFSTGELDYGLMTPARRVVEDFLGAAPGERLVLLFDEANLEVARALHRAALDAGAESIPLCLEHLGTRPVTVLPAPVVEALDGSSLSILLVGFEDGEYEMRREHIRKAAAARAKHIHMVGVSRAALVDTLSVTPSRIFEFTDRLRAALRASSRIEARGGGGTELRVELDPALRWYTNGRVAQPGTWQNIPFGSLGTSPGSVEGRYVVNAAISGAVGARAGALGSRPITLHVERGVVRGVECNDPILKRHVESFLASGRDNDRVGMIVVGTNLGMREPLGEILHDENMPGVHLSLGNTYPEETGATWSGTGQLGFASVELDVDLDGVPLIRRGRYVRFL